MTTTALVALVVSSPLSPAWGVREAWPTLFSPNTSRWEPLFSTFLCSGWAGQGKLRHREVLACPGHPRNPLSLGPLGKQPAGPCPARRGFKSQSACSVLTRKGLVVLPQGGWSTQ